MSDSLNIDVKKEAVDLEYLESMAQDPEISIPLEVHIGFYSNVKYKVVKEHVLSYAEKNFSSLKDVYYDIRKFEDGYLYEIHHGGESLGYLDDYIKNKPEESVIVSSGDVYRVQPSSHGGVRLIRLTDSDVKLVHANPENFRLLTQGNKLKPISSSGYPMYVFGLVVLIAGLASLFMSAVLKYVVLDKTEVIYYSNENKTYPHEYISEIKNKMYDLDLSSEYFKSVIIDMSKKPSERVILEKGSVLVPEQLSFDDVSSSAEKEDSIGKGE